MAELFTPMLNKLQAKLVQQDFSRRRNDTCISLTFWWKKSFLLVVVNFQTPTAPK